MKNQLEIRHVSIRVKGKNLVEDVSFTLRPGEIHGLMGPNGSGKTSLCFGLMGHPHYELTRGSIHLNGKAIEGLEPNDRAKAGLFLSFQQPPAFEGVTVAHFLRTAYNILHGTQIRALEFRSMLDEKMKLLHMDSSFRKRPLNQGFSGGERKRMEMLQLAMLQPHYAMLDETDSGLDVDALKIIGQSLKLVQEHHPLGALIISHNPRLFRLVKPHRVHVMLAGKLVKSGGSELLKTIEEKGYDVFKS